MSQGATKNLPGCPFLSEGQPPSLEYALDMARHAQERGIITNRQCVLLAFESDPKKVLAEVQAWENINLPRTEAAGLITSACREILQLFPTSVIPRKIMDLVVQHKGWSNVPHMDISIVVLQEQPDSVQGPDAYKAYTYAKTRLNTLLRNPEQPLNLASF